MRFKNFIVFGYDDCYPSGGLNDIKGSFDTYGEAWQFFMRSVYNNNRIVNRDTWELLKSD